MIVYKYDKVTKEYKGKTIAYKDAVASHKAGKDVFIKPVYTTEIKPPEVKENEVAVFTGNGWKVEKDFRGKMIYDLSTRKGQVMYTIGAIPRGFAMKLPERLEDVKDTYLKLMKTNFDVCIENTKVKIPSLDYYFSYKSLDRLKKEKETGILMSRDDNNKIYSLTSQEYDDIINYLLVYGQFMYLQKWTVENALKKCTDLELLKTYNTKLDFKVDTKQIDNIAKLSMEKRKEYFARMAKSIK